MLTINDISKEEILNIIKKAINLKKDNKNIKNNKSIANIFIEPSTRTKISFEKAEKELGMEIYNIEFNNSSFKKNENLFDVINTLKSYNIKNFVIRSDKSEYWKELNNINDINIINAGDGKNNHPTQALLDAMTIYEHFNKLDNLKILICGDIKNSRVYHSFKDLIKNFNSELLISAPNELQENDSKIKYVDFNKTLSKVDVIIMLRIQHERHNIKFNEKNYNKKYGINDRNIKLIKDGAIIMHPGPINRGFEMANNILYDDKKIKILDQVKNGLYIRKIILSDLK